MKNENDFFSVQMFRVENDWAPFVKVGYVDQDAVEHTALMVVDSCSTHSVLFGSYVAKCGLLVEEENDSMEVIGLGDAKESLGLVKWSFIFGGKRFEETFGVREGDFSFPSEIGGIPFIGILGNMFLQRYRLAIDYSDHTIHTSNVTRADLPITDCDFFFPMEIGLEKYGIPVLAIRQNGVDVVALADTGANGNIIALQSVEECGFDCQFSDSTEKLSGIIGDSEGRDATMKFSLLTLTEKGIEGVPFESSFKVTPHYVLEPEEDQCDEDGEQLPPIEGIIGSPFMGKEGWVLDFGINYIYKRNADAVLRSMMNPRVDISKAKRAIQGEAEKCEETNWRRIGFFINVMKYYMPLVRVENGDFEGVVFLIDSGACENVIFGYAFHQLEEFFKPSDARCEISGIEGNPVTLNCVFGTLSFSGKDYATRFVVSENSEAILRMSQEVGFAISGILGTKFMAEHGWMIDIGKQEIVIPPYDVSSSDYEAAIKSRSKKE